MNPKANSKAFEIGSMKKQFYKSTLSKVSSILYTIQCSAFKSYNGGKFYNKPRKENICSQDFVITYKRIESKSKCSTVITRTLLTFKGTWSR